MKKYKHYQFDLLGQVSIRIYETSYQNAIERFSVMFGENLLTEVLTIYCIECHGK